MYEYQWVSINTVDLGAAGQQGWRVVPIEPIRLNESSNRFLLMERQGKAE